MSYSNVIRVDDLRFDEGIFTSYLDFNPSSVSLRVIRTPILGDYRSDGYLYYAHIKRDPKENWESNIPLGSWVPAEQRARTSRLWEGCRDWTYNYYKDPENNRPSFLDLALKLVERNFLAEATLLREVYQF